MVNYMIAILDIPTPIVLGFIGMVLLPLIRQIEVWVNKWQLKNIFMLLWTPVLFADLLQLYFQVEDGPLYLSPANAWYSFAFRLTKLNVILALVITTMLFLVTIYSLDYLKFETLLDDEGTYKLYYLFMSLAVLIGQYIILFANDLFSLFIGWELMALSGYALISFRQRKGASEAGFKYTIQSSIGSIFLLLGISMVYGITGTLNVDEAARIINTAYTSPQTPAEMALQTNPIMIYQTIVFFLVGIGVTAGFVGMHTWIPDAYGEAPSSIGALVSGSFSTIAIIALSTTILRIFPQYLETVGWILFIGSLLTMTVGNLGGILQKDMRRLLGYSSIAQRGYLLFGLSAYALVRSNEAKLQAQTALLLQMISYIFLEAILFFVVGEILWRTWVKIGSRDLNVMKGATYNRPLLGAALVLAGLGMAGFPPTIGFIGKLAIGTAAAHIPNYALVGLVIFALNSAVSMAYYSKLIGNLVFSKPSEKVKEAITESTGLNMLDFTIIISLVIVLVIGLYPSLLTGILDTVLFL